MTDFFKVIYMKSTQEVEPIPHKWEEDGVLYWPPTKALVRQLQSNAGSVPDKYTWKRYECVVKATNILLYMHASAQADQICEETSDITTDDERGRPAHVKPLPTNSKRYAVGKNKKITSYEFNSSTDSQPEKQAHIRRERTFIESTVSDSDGDSENNISKQISTLTLKVDELSKGFRKIEEKMTQKFADVLVRLDHLYDVVKKSEASLMVSEEELNIFPITSMEDLQTFENDLADPTYKNKVLVQLKRSVGSAMPHKAACYKLAGVMFTKELLTNYSWTGMSRSFEKKPFNRLNRLLDLFFKVIFKSDNSFTYPARDSFFRDCILKHSNTRLRLSKRNTISEENAYCLDNNNYGDCGMYTIEEDGELRKEELL